MSSEWQRILSKTIAFEEHDNHTLVDYHGFPTEEERWQIEKSYYKNGATIEVLDIVLRDNSPQPLVKLLIKKNAV